MELIEVTLIHAYLQEINRNYIEDYENDKNIFLPFPGFIIQFTASS